MDAHLVTDANTQRHTDSSPNKMLSCGSQTGVRGQQKRFHHSSVKNKPNGEEKKYSNVTVGHFVNRCDNSGAVKVSKQEEENEERKREAAKASGYGIRDTCNGFHSE